MRNLVITFFILSLILSGCNYFSSSSEEDEVMIDSMGQIYLLDICVDSLLIEERILRSGENLSILLGKAGINATLIDSISKLSAEVFDLTKMRAGQQYTLLKDSADISRFLIYRNNLTEYIVFDLRTPMQVYRYKKNITNKRKVATGIITNSLWQTITKDGGDPLLAFDLSDIYAWQIDFFGIGKGDWYKVIYEQACVDDSVEVEISSIVAAQFNHLGKNYYAIPFEQDSILEYFDEQGENLRKAFLKAPLKYSRISSVFSHARRHPILKIVRPHHGVDYAAPIGTPVQSIGAGTVVKKAFQPNGAGNVIVVKHNSMYSTTYMHLSKFAKGLQVGSRVSQGEVIGYVGSSGLSSGPHLDFRVHKNGTPINPLSMESPPSDPVKECLRDSFKIKAQSLVMQLDSISLPN